MHLQQKSVDFIYLSLNYDRKSWFTVRFQMTGHYFVSRQKKFFFFLRRTQFEFDLVGRVTPESSWCHRADLRESSGVERVVRENGSVKIKSLPGGMSDVIAQTSESSWRQHADLRELTTSSRRPPRVVPSRVVRVGESDVGESDVA